RRFNGSTAESYLVSAAQPTAAPRLVAPRMPDLRYTVDHWNDRLVILTDVDGAVDMKVMTAPIDRPERENWQELVPHRPGRSIVALHPFRDGMVRLEWKDAKPQLVVMRPDGGEQDVTFDEQAYTLDLPRGQDWDATSLTFGYESPRLPRETRRLTLSTGAQAAASPAIRSASFDPNRFVVERLEVPSTDGVRVPVTLLRRRDAARDGRSPLYLYAYGSYGAIQEASFVPANLALVERGWTFAIAHVRGGGERGSQWWRQVLRTGKKRSFEDYLACADHLVRNGYTAAGRIVAEGFSAGGLLIGNAVVERPELFAGIVGRAAYVDPLGAKDIKDHPLGPSAIPIWGDPANPAEYAYIASYAPYEHLRKASLPAMLMVSSIADDRVMYTDALKFALRARALTTGGQPMMAKIASVGGHVGLPGPEAAAERKALFHAFAIWAADHRWGEVPQR
ncbi:MAG TPA: prolyl oligopeptidase family serine peptidase, partial [Sphingobium sp.]|nr:prolyl oligopeptidase family serine peptidase [Sphingobium sp.]